MGMRAFFFVMVVICSRESVAATSFTLVAEDDYFPYSALIDDKLVGMVPELAVAAYREVGVEVEFTVRPYPRVLLMVANGTHVGGFTGAIDASNADNYHWHPTPLGSVRLAIWARKGQTGKQPLIAADLEGRRVSITHGFFYTDAIDQNEEIEKVIAPSDMNSLRMLALGRSDFALVTERIGYGFLKSDAASGLGDRIEVVGLIDEVPLHAFFSKTHPQGKAAAELFEQGLQAIIDNGIYKQIHNRWSPQAN